jgi:hypothetical protein
MSLPPRSTGATQPWDIGLSAATMPSPTRTIVLDDVRSPRPGQARGMRPPVGLAQADGRLRFNLESALGIGKVMDDAVRDRLVEGWNGTVSTLDDVRFRGRGEGTPMCC